MPPQDSPGRSAEAGDDVLKALERTLGSRAARIEFSFAHHFAGMAGDSRRRRQNGLLRPVTRAGGALVKRVVTAGVGKLSSAGSGQGVLDFERRRSIVDYGGFVVVTIADTRWSGASGRPLAGFEEIVATTMEPMWLVDLARGTTDAAVEGREPVHGRECCKFLAHADLSRAAAASPGELALSPAGFYSDLLRSPFRAWVDDEGYIRRLRHDSKVFSVALELALELLEFGIDVPADWSCLPMLSSPVNAD